MPNPAKPLKFKVLAGTERPCRPDPDAAAPQFEVVREFPEPPQHLNPDGVEMWQKLGPQLVACGLLQVVDLYALEQLCYTWQQFRQKSKAGFEVTASENNALTALWQQFGLTPSARRRVVANIAEAGKPNRFAGHGQKAR